MSYYISKAYQFSQQPFAVQWRAGLVRLPWLVPKAVLTFTSPEGPVPEIIQLPSREDGRTIPVYLFVAEDCLASSYLPPTPKASDSTGAASVGASSTAASAGSGQQQRQSQRQRQLLKLPVLLDFHGGGFIMGSCLEQAPWCAMIARMTGRVVVSVDYRKGPLDQFPAAIEDAEDVLAALMDVDLRTDAGRVLDMAVRRRANVDNRKMQGEPRPRGASPSSMADPLDASHGGGAPVSILDADRIALSGFSSGGNLALNLLLSVQVDDASGDSNCKGADSGGASRTSSTSGLRQWPVLFAPTGPPIPTLLFYPSFDSSLLPHERPRPPKMKSGTGSWFASLGSVLGPTYLPANMRRHPRASPGLNSMKDCLSRRSRILLILPEIDSLAMQSDVWVKKMQDEGLQDMLEVHRVEDVPHGWTQFPDTFLDQEARRRKYATFDRAMQHLKNFSSLQTAMV